MRVAVTLAIGLAIAAIASAALIHVPGSAPTIQEGLNMASAGDTVLVAPGTYAGALNRDLDFSGTNAILCSSGGAEATTIDCEGQGRGFRFHSGEDTTCVVRGFSVIGGYAENGGGVIIEGDSSPVIEDCIFRDCVAAVAGGAVYCSSDYARVWLRGCSFYGNTAELDRGAGVFCLGGWLQLSDCVFAGNSAPNSGGAVYSGECSYPATIVRCVFESNTTTWNGGGVFTESYIHDSMSPLASSSDAPPRVPFLLEDCVFLDNAAGRLGGAICLWGGGLGASGDVVNCRFVRNSAERGGAVADESGLGSLIGCVFSRNSAETGGGLNVRNWGPMFFESCTFSFNEASSGSAFNCGRFHRTLTNLIIAFSSGGEAVVCSGDPPLLTHSVIYGNTHGDKLCCDMVDNLFVDPLFCDAALDDLTLCANSSCLPDSNAWGELVGAMGKGCGQCDSPVQAQSWGSIKAMYR